MVLALGVCAVVAGARSYAAIGQWAGDLSAQQVTRLGLSRVSTPDASTFRRVFSRLDAGVLDAAVGAFLWTRTRVVAGPAGRRRIIAVDGKTVRGARTATTTAPHLVAAFDHGSGTILGQVATAAKSNEIPAVRTLLAAFDLAADGGVVVTVDAMHTQTDTADLITAAGGDYVFTVKANQPKLYAACKRLPWREVPSHATVTQEKLGEAAALSRSFVSLVEHGSDHVSLLRLWRVASALGLPVVELLDSDETGSRTR